MWRERPDAWNPPRAPREWMNPDDAEQWAYGRGGGRAGQTQLSRDPGAPKVARDWVDRHFGTELSDDKLAIAQLLVSELVTNALMHGRGAIVLRAQLEDGRLRAEVIDEGDGFDWSEPKPDPDRVRGWGLSVVAGGSDRWGIREGANHVWFELNL
jgi:anti-sigma regulatory factor (Ser/Thr protein kinase)